MQALAWLRSSGRVGADWSRELAGNSLFHRAFADFLQRYGHRGVYETYLRNPRWREAPDYLCWTLLPMLGSGSAGICRYGCGP